MRAATRYRMLENIRAITPSGNDPYHALDRQLHMMSDAGLTAWHRGAWRAVCFNARFQEIVTDEDRARVTAHCTAMKSRKPANRPIRSQCQGFAAYPAPAND